MQMKPKLHQFFLTVKTSLTRKQAELAVLHAFAKRQPDNCEFHLKKYPGHREIWMEGSAAGFDMALDLMGKTLEMMRKK